MMNKLALSSLLLAISMLAAPQGWSQTVRAGYTSRDLNYLPFFVAQRRGFQAQEGVQVELVSIGRSDIQLQALVTGDLHFANINADGVIIWNERSKLGKGSLTCAGGKLILYSERGGECVLIDASPEGWIEHGRFKIDPQTTQRASSGGIWTHPVVANGKLFLRDQELLACYDIRAN